MKYFNNYRHLRNQSFVIEAEIEEGIKAAQAWAQTELGMQTTHSTTFGARSNPDFVVLRYGLFSVEDARRVLEVATSASFAGAHKVVVIAASRAYHEAQNALLKLFEEPPSNTYIFLVLPTLGSLLQTLRSRVQVLNVMDFVNPSSDDGFTKSIIPKAAEEFLKASKEKRSAMIKKLASGKDEEEKRELREEAIAILNGIEALAYATVQNVGFTKSNMEALFSDIAVLRAHLYDRSAPVKMILEHLSLVIPRDLV